MTIETGHRSFASPVDAEQVGRAMLQDRSATETELLATAAAMIGTSVGGHGRAARIRRVADALRARAHGRMIVRAVRAAVADHARRDPLAEPLDLDIVGDRSFDGSTIYTRADAVRYRLDAIRFARGGMRGETFPEQARRTVREALKDAKVEGLASDLDNGYQRHRDEIVIDVRYAETWRATYAVAPDGRAVCWID